MLSTIDQQIKIKMKLDIKINLNATKQSEILILFEKTSSLLRGDIELVPQNEFVVTCQM